MMVHARVRGRVILTLSGGGQPTRTWATENMVMNGGLSDIASLMIGSTTPVPTHVALGTGTTAVAANQTALATGDNTTWRSIVARTKYSTYIASYETTYSTSLANGTWSEIALYSGGTGTAFSGTMFARALVTVTKTSSQVLSVAWRVQVS